MSWSSLLAQKLRPDENGNLPSALVLLGSEPLLAIEAQDAIRAAAFKAGYSERKSFVLKATPITRLFTKHSATRAFSAKKSD